MQQLQEAFRYAYRAGRAQGGVYYENVEEKTYEIGESYAREEKKFAKF